MHAVVANLTITNPCAPEQASAGEVGPAQVQALECLKHLDDQ